MVLCITEAGRELSIPCAPKMERKKTKLARSKRKEFIYIFNREGRNAREKPKDANREWGGVVLVS